MATKPKRPRDLNQLAHAILGEASGENISVDPDAGKDAAKVKAGRKGGQSGGKARARTLDPAKRAEIAKKAAAARWRKKKK